MRSIVGEASNKAVVVTTSDAILAAHVLVSVRNGSVCVGGVLDIRKLLEVHEGWEICSGQGDEAGYY